MVAQTTAPTTPNSNAPTTATTDTTDTTDTTGSATTNDTNGSGSSIDAVTGSRIALPAGQIIAILQEKPEVIIELKSLLADMLQQQGIQIQPDSITDETLFSQIASSSAVRANITTFLRARGYISDADLQRSITAGGDSDESPASVETLETLFHIPRTHSH